MWPHTLRPTISDDNDWEVRVWITLVYQRNRDAPKLWVMAHHLFSTRRCARLCRRPFTKKLHHGLYGTWQTSYPSTISSGERTGALNARASPSSTSDDYLHVLFVFRLITSKLPITSGLASPPPAHGYDHENDRSELASRRRHLRSSVPYRCRGEKPKCATQCDGHRIQHIRLAEKMDFLSPSKTFNSTPFRRELFDLRINGGREA